DSQPSRELFAEVIEAIQTGRYLAGGCTVILDGSYPMVGNVARVWNVISRTMKYVAGSFIFCETAAFRQLGGFDIRLYASEEINLSRRLKRLAREQGRKLIILHRHPLVTSARKIHLYSLREHFHFFTRTILNWRGTLGDRGACHTWYDGRR
ncbi:MAG: hypothetical protein JWR69_2850, partial [Pedosphaera sp.]|nr:hypothetical protein [Pedosphaera sp.]